MKFHITRPDAEIAAALQEKIDDLTKPKGSLGRLEELALRMGLVQQTLTPELRRPTNILFAADHGVIDEGVSVSPKEVTWQQLAHFSRGGAGINFLCEQHGFDLVLVDAGVDYDIPSGCGIRDCKVRRGTRNFAVEAALTPEEVEEALRRGAEVVDDVARGGCNVVSFGEMGSGNTTPSSAWMHAFTGIPLEECVGAGAGLDSAGVRRKLEVLRRGFELHGNPTEPMRVMEAFGGLEMIMAVGGMLRAAERGMLIIVDGFIMTACMLCASRMHPEVMDYAVFGHCGDESGHRRMLEAMGVRALLHLDLRLGEGSGAVCSYPILQSAVDMINKMDRFSDASVTRYFE